MFQTKDSGVGWERWRVGCVEDMSFAEARICISGVAWREDVQIVLKELAFHLGLA